jgi:hypothetical protein
MRGTDNPTYVRRTSGGSKLFTFCKRTLADCGMMSFDRFPQRWGPERRCPDTYSRRSWCCSLLLLLAAPFSCTAWQVPHGMPYARTTHRNDRDSYRRSAMTSDSSVNDSEERSSDSVQNIQWELFRKHHARFRDAPDDGPVTTSWVGRWTTYDYVGDILLETMPAAVNYMYTSAPSSNDAKVQVTHTISTGSVSSDCATCFDDPNMSRTIPITVYTPESIGSKTRLGACSMVVGPSILQKSGTSTSSSIALISYPISGWHSTLDLSHHVVCSVGSQWHWRSCWRIRLLGCA